MGIDDIDIQVDDSTAPDYEVADNFVENLVDAIRSDMVGNEEQFVLFNLVYATGLFRDPSTYAAAEATGSSSSGKSALKGSVDSYWPNHWLLNITDTSDKGLIDDSRWNDRYIFAGDEQNKLPAKATEILKSSYGDDADENGFGYTYVRSKAADDDEEEKEEIKKQTLPFVLLVADENAAKGSDWELSTRVMDVKVEEDSEINDAVGATMFDHRHVTVEHKEHDYNFKFEKGKQAIKNHIANIPRPLPPLSSEDPKKYASPVLIPHGEFADWDAYEVVRPIFDFNQSESKRAASTIASLIRASALLNYHTRNTVEVDGMEHYVAEPQDVANVLACRKTLLGLTHNLDEKKLAVIEALTDDEHGVGGVGPNGGLAAPKKHIHEYIENHASITSLTDHYLDKTLEDMADRFLITIHEEEGENGAHLYEYNGGSTFGHPNFDAYPSLFDGCRDPIRDQPIQQTAEELKEELHTRTASDIMDGDDPMASEEKVATKDSSEDSEGGLSDFGGGDDTSSIELNKVEQKTAEALRETVDDCRVHADDDELSVQHMVGVSDVEYYENEDGLRFVKPKGAETSADLHGSWMDPTDSLWGDNGPNQVITRVTNAIAKLKDEGVFTIHEDSEEVRYLEVSDV